MIMSDAVHLEHGAAPWQPSADVRTIAVLHRYDIPLAGLIEQHGVKYVYWCVTGHAAPESAWAYAHVSDADAVRLQEADGVSFDAVLRAVVADCACAFAVADDDRGIIASVLLNPPASFDDVHRRGMAEMSDRYREMFEEYQMLQERFPLLQSAAHFGLMPSPVTTAHAPDLAPRG
jgi:hypothetical protein